jgi:DNA-binding LytR/AlgR family response regulator
MRKILVIDDDKCIIESIKRLLKIIGYEVKGAEDGTKGIKIAKEFVPDLIICDISMPMMDGYSVFNELSKDPKTSVIPFIFLTAKAEISDLKIGMQLGADDYICKPYSSNELIHSIELRFRKKDKIIDYFESKNRPEPKIKKGKDKNSLYRESQILLMVGDHPQNFKIGDIVYIKSLEKYSTVFTIDGKKEIIKKMMKEWEEALPENLFIRIHRSTIINLDYVSKFEKWFNYTYRVFLENVEEPFIVSRRISEKLRKSF